MEGDGDFVGVEGVGGGFSMTASPTSAARLRPCSAAGDRTAFRFGALPMLRPAKRLRAEWPARPARNALVGVVVEGAASASVAPDAASEPAAASRNKRSTPAGQVESESNSTINGTESSLAVVMRERKAERKWSDARSLSGERREASIERAVALGRAPS